MGILDSLKTLFSDFRDAVVGIDRAKEFRRRKRVAARRRYRANRRRRALAVVEEGKSPLTNHGEGLSTIVSYGNNSNNDSTSSVCVDGIAESYPNNMHEGNFDDVDGFNDVESFNDVLNKEVEQEQDDNTDSISLSDCVGVSSIDGDVVFDGNADNGEDEGHGNPGQARAKEGILEGSPVEGLVDGPEETLGEGLEGGVNQGLDEGQVEEVASSVASSVTSSDTGSVAGSVFCNGILDDGNSPRRFSNRPPEDDLVVPVPANHQGYAEDLDHPMNNVQWRIPRRSSPWLLSRDFRLPNIPKISASDDAVWTDAVIPDLMGLVVDANEVGKVYVVPRSLFGNQVYTARHLSYPHTVMDLPTELPGYLQQLQNPAQVVWYAPDKDTRDDFFVVLNRPESVLQAIGNYFPFQELARYTSQHERDDPDQLERQRAKINRGWTGTQSMPTRDLNGHPMPSIKEGSRDPIIIQTLQAASDYIRSLPVPWNGNQPLEVPSDRTSRFASQLGDGILFEGVTHTTHQRCGWHRDVQNPAPDEPSVSHVTCINKKLETGGYIVSIYYFRLSVSVNLQMNSTGDPILRHFVETFLSFPPERRSFSRASVGRGDGFCAIAPNLDPISFHSLADICIVSMAHRFRLSLYETVSLIVCFLYMPNTTEPFARAAVRILQDGRLGRNTYGHRVGFMVARWMVQEQRSFNVRFNIYRGEPVLDEKLFESHTISLFWMVVHVWSAYPVRPGNTVVAKAYTAIRDLLKSLFFGVGNLIAMHTIQMLAEIGLLPQWLQTYACFDHTGRVFKWYAAKFSVPPTAVQARRMMASIPTGMERFLSFWVNESLLENLACKNFQRDGGGLECRRDVHHCKAPIVARSANGRGLKIVFSRGDEIALPNDCMIPSWRFGGHNMSMVEIADFLELPKALPGLRSLRSSRLPDEATASPTTSNIPFDLPRWYS